MSLTASKLEKHWQKNLASEFKLPYMKQLKSFLSKEKKDGKKIFPATSEIFTALNLTPLNKVKIVIIGQDPYHGDNQAHGLSFSVKKGIKPPPSLINIFKELKTDVNFKIPDHGYLEPWAKQGVLMLNAVLTVEKGNAGSHQKKGWEKFTDKIIDILNKDSENIVFILWGSYAQKKGAKIDKSKHLVIESCHPSPLSSYRGFFGSRPFSKANIYLRKNGKKEINWQI